MTLAIAARVPPEVARDTVATTLLQQGWAGRWLDPWSAVAHQGLEGGSALTAPPETFCEIRWAVVVGSFGETVVHIEQTRDAWADRGGPLEERRARRHLDVLIAALIDGLPSTAVAEPTS